MPLQFLTRHPAQPVVVWCDLMKRGRMTGTELDEVSEQLALVLKKRPSDSMALVIAPYLVSEKVDGYRGEMRTV